jgi:hypothetical protein
MVNQDERIEKIKTMVDECYKEVDDPRLATTLLALKELTDLVAELTRLLAARQLI